jgi:hypothetical protein
VPKLKVVKPIIRANRMDITKEKRIRWLVKIILKKPRNLVLNKRNRVDSKSKVDSREVKRIIIFLLSHKKGRNRQEKITPGLLIAMLASEASKLLISKPALLVSSSLCKAW